MAKFHHTTVATERHENNNKHNITNITLKGTKQWTLEQSWNYIDNVNILWSLALVILQNHMSSDQPYIDIENTISQYISNDQLPVVFCESCVRILVGDLTPSIPLLRLPPTSTYIPVYLITGLPYHLELRTLVSIWQNHVDTWFRKVTSSVRNGDNCCSPQWPGNAGDLEMLSPTRHNFIGWSFGNHQPILWNSQWLMMINHGSTIYWVTQLVMWEITEYQHSWTLTIIIVIISSLPSELSIIMERQYQL